MGIMHTIYQFFIIFKSIPDFFHMVHKVAKINLKSLYQEIHIFDFQRFKELSLGIDYVSECKDIGSDEQYFFNVPGTGFFKDGILKILYISVNFIEYGKIVVNKRIDDLVQKETGSLIQDLIVF